MLTSCAGLYWILIEYIFYITYGFKTIWVKWIFAIAFPYIQMLRWGGQNPWWTVHALILLNQYSFWSITCCKAISPVAKFNHVLGRGFMIQQEILILSQSEWTILHGTIILTIISFSDKVLLVYYLFEMKNYIQCKVNVNDKLITQKVDIHSTCFVYLKCKCLTIFWIKALSILINISFLFSNIFSSISEIYRLEGFSGFFA